MRNFNKNILLNLVLLKAPFLALHSWYFLFMLLLMVLSVLMVMINSAIRSWREKNCAPRLLIGTAPNKLWLEVVKHTLNIHHGISKRDLARKLLLGNPPIRLKVEVVMHTLVPVRTFFKHLMYVVWVEWCLCFYIVIKQIAIIKITKTKRLCVLIFNLSFITS